MKKAQLLNFPARIESARVEDGKPVAVIHFVSALDAREFILNNDVYGDGYKVESVSNNDVKVRFNEAGALVSLSEEALKRDLKYQFKQGLFEWRS